MKEATGELNATVVVVLLVGAVIAFFFYFLAPMLKDDVGKTADCSSSTCKEIIDDDGYLYCKICDGDRKKCYCPYKG